MNKKNGDKYADIKKKVRNVKGFYEHLTVYLIVNFFLFLKDVLDSREGFKFYETSIIWGIFLLFHAAEVIFDNFFGSKWEERKIRKKMNKNKTQESNKDTNVSKGAFPKLALKIAPFIVVGLFIGWYLFIGYHNHQVIIQRSDILTVIKSKESKFEFSLPDKRAKRMNEYAINRYKMSSELGKPFHINGHGIIKSIQTIHLPDSISTYKFAVNDMEFTLKGNNLYQGKNNWYLQPNDPLIINVDKMN